MDIYFEDNGNTVKTQTIRLTSSRYRYGVFKLIIESKYFEPELAVTYSPLVKDGKEIKHAVTLLNGEKGGNAVAVDKGGRKVLYFALDLSKAETGEWRGIINIGGTLVNLFIDVTDKPVFDYGVSETESLCRLKWLESKAYTENTVQKGYKPIVVGKNKLGFLGKEVYFERNSLPAAADFYFDNSTCLTADVQNSLFFKAAEIAPELKFSACKISERQSGVSVHSAAQNDSVSVEISADAKCYGKLEYSILCTAVKDTVFNGLNIKFFFSACRYRSGIMDGEGVFENGYTFIGDVNAGAFVNYKSACGVRLTDVSEGAELTIGFGKKVLPKGETAELKFDILFTPFKPYDLKEAFYSSAWRADKKEITNKTVKEVSARGAKTVILSQNSAEMPVPNFPFIYDRKPSQIIDGAHDAGLDILFPLLPSSVSEKNPDFKAFLEMGGIVESRAAERDGDLHPAKGGAYENYMIETAGYIINEYRADGFTVPAENLSESFAERLCKMIEKRKGKPAYLEISADGGKLPPYRNVLPFADKIRTNISSDSETDALEQSGIMFGVPVVPADNGEPLFCMLLGMFPEFGSDDKKKELTLKSLSAIITSFDLGSSKMYGYWDASSPITTDKSDVKVTAYVGGDTMLAVIYNTSKDTQKFYIGINPRKNFTSAGKKIYTPLVLGHHPERKTNLNKIFKLKGKEGMLLFIKK